MSNGEVEIANISDPENIEFFTWSSPSKYYEDGYCEGKVFMLLTVEETEEYSDSEAIKNGEKVYDDGSYVVYTYSASEELMSYKAER